MKNCNSKLKIQNTLINKEIINKEGKILKSDVFNRENKEITAAAGSIFNVYSDSIISSKDNFIIYDDEAFEKINKKINSRPRKYSDDMLLSVGDINAVKSSKKKVKTKEQIEDNINFYTKAQKIALDTQKHKKIINQWKNKHNESSDFVKQLDIHINKLHENIVQYLNIAKHSGHEGYINVVQKLEKDISEALNEDLSKLDSIKQLRFILKYITFAVSQLDNVSQRVDKLISKDLDFDSKEFGDLRRYITDYYQNFDITEDLGKFVDEYYRAGHITDEMYSEIIEGLGKISKYIGTVDSKIKNLNKSASIELFGTPEYFPVIEMEYRNKFEKESNKQKNITTGKKLNKVEKDLWVNKQMVLHKEEIEVETRKKFKELINSPFYDISDLSFYFNTDALISEHFIQIFTRMMSKKESEKIEKTQEHIKIFKKEIEKINATPKDFDAIVEQDKDGNFYLKGTYNIKILDKLKEFDFKIRHAKTYKIIKKIKNERLKYLNSISTYNNVDKVRTMNKNTEFVDLSNLTETQKQLREILLNLTLQSHNIITSNGLKNRHNSLVKSYSNIIDLEFYRLPAILKTTFGKLLDIEFGKAVAKLGRELTKIEKDDVEEALSTKLYGEYADVNEVYSGLKGEKLNTLFVAFRGMIGNEQNLDFKTIYAKEIENMYTYESNFEIESDAQIFLDTIKGMEFYVTDGINKKLNISVFKKKELENYNTDLGIKSNVVKKIISMLENDLYSKTTIYAGKIFNTYDTNRVVNTFIGYSSYLTMALRTPGAAANLFNGWLMGLAEGHGGEHYTKTDLLWANAEYTKHFAELIADIGSPVKISKINQLAEYFDVFGEYSQLYNEFERKNKITQLMKFNSLFGMYSAGEHQMQSIVMLAILNSKKATNSKGEYINKEGKVVKDIKKAASLYEMFDIDKETGLLIKNKYLNNTTHSLITHWGKGGREDIKNLIKGLIFDIFGNYDKKRQSHIQRMWYGKLLMHYKKFLEPAILRRFRGISNIVKNNEDILDKNKFHNMYKKTYDEQGFSVTFIKTYLRSIRQHQLDLVSLFTLKGIKEELSNHELSNLRRAHAELVMIGELFIIASALASFAKANSDDDDDLLWWGSYLLRRGANETSQFYSIPEFSRMYKNPIASYKQLNNLFNLVSLATGVSGWGDDYEQGQYKGQNKLWVKSRNMLVPKSFIFNYDPSIKQMYTFYDNPGSIVW